MKAVRIYKDDIRTSILRSLFFTDTVLAVGGGLLIGGIVYIFFQTVLHYFIWGHFLAVLVISEVFFIGLITQRIHNQPIYKIIPRAITHMIRRKQMRYKDLDSYFTDFIIQDNLLIRKDSLVRMYHIEPFDIALLNDEDREHFFVKLKQMIHILPAQVQFIVRKEAATTADYSKHFFSLFNQADNKHEPVIAEYVEDMTDLLNKHTFFTVRHYAIFSVPANREKIQSKMNGIQKLNDIGRRFAGALQACNIEAKSLTNEELANFMQTTLR
jgi:hypothetical protein